MDLSLTSLGYAHTDGETFSAIAIKPGKVREHERLQLLVERILVPCDAADLVVVEGPAYGAKGSAYHQLAGLWWLVTHELWRRAIPVAVAPPSSVKRYATGKGVADKDAMMLATARRFSSFTGDNNAADALWLACLGADHLGSPLVVMPAAHRKALDGITWPVMS